MKNQPQAPLTTGRHYVRASSRFARRLWCCDACGTVIPPGAKWETVRVHGCGLTNYTRTEEWCAACFEKGGSTHDIS